jgi:outer membrane protein assembly factor BamB
VIVLASVALLAMTGPGASATTTTTTTSTTDTITGTTAPSSTSGGSSWTVYHGDPAGAGLATTVAGVTTTRRAWTSPTLDGALYGEPLVSGDLVYVATEDDTVYALSSTSGAVVWSARLGTPVPASRLPCGDVTPDVGITGTPVVDPARSELFVVADELVNGTPVHRLVGLDATTGRVELTQAVDPAGSTPSALLQRTGLTLDAGQVVFGFGGNYGDCARYRGWVAAVPEGGGTPSDFAVDAAADESQGAVWMGGGAPAVDTAGDIWVGVGNGSVTSSSHAYDDSDSVLELSSAMALLQYFAPTSWATDNAHDLDMSTVPALLSDGQVLAAGKSRIAYLLGAHHLGGIGGEETSLATGCQQDIDGGVAYVGTTVYLPCLAGIMAVGVTSSPARIRVLWSSGTGGGPPIVAAGLVWTIGQDGTLYGLDPATGAVRQRASIGAEANHFPTPSVGDGLLLAPTADSVVAFTASPVSSTSTTNSTATATTTTTTAPINLGSDAGSSSGGGLSDGNVAAIVIGGILAVAFVGAALLGRRRRRNRRSEPPSRG